MFGASYCRIVPWRDPFTANDKFGYFCRQISESPFLERATFSRSCDSFFFSGVHSQFQFPSSRNTAEEKRGENQWVYQQNWKVEVNFVNHNSNRSWYHFFHYIISQKCFNAYIRESLYDLCILVDQPPYYNEPSRLSWWLILLLTLATVNLLLFIRLKFSFAPFTKTLTIRNWGFSAKKKL